MCTTMIETRMTDNSGSEGVGMTDSAFISPSSSPGQATGMVLLLHPHLPPSSGLGHAPQHLPPSSGLGHAPQHLSPPLTPAESSSVESSPPEPRDRAPSSADEDERKAVGGGTSRKDGGLYGESRHSYSDLFTTLCHQHQRYGRTFSGGSRVGGARDCHHKEREEEEEEDESSSSSSPPIMDGGHPRSTHDADVSCQNDDAALQRQDNNDNDVSDCEEMIDVIGDYDDDNDDDDNDADHCDESIAITSSDFKKDASDVEHDIISGDESKHEQEAGAVTADRYLQEGGGDGIDSGSNKKTKQHNMSPHWQQSSPTSTTNFSIDAILKPDFGPTKKTVRLDDTHLHGINHHHSHHQTHNNSYNHSNNKNNHSNKLSPPAPHMNRYSPAHHLHHHHHHHHHPSYDLMKPLLNLQAQYFQLHRQHQQNHQQPHHHHHDRHHHHHHQNNHHQHEHPQRSPQAVQNRQHHRLQFEEQKVRPVAHKDFPPPHHHLTLHQHQHPRIPMSSPNTDITTPSPLSSSLSLSASPVDLSTRGRGVHHHHHHQQEHGGDGEDRCFPFQPDLAVASKRRYGEMMAGSVTCSKTDSKSRDSINSGRGRTTCSSNSSSSGGVTDGAPVVGKDKDRRKGATSPSAANNSKNNNNNNNNSKNSTSNNNNNNSGNNAGVITTDNKHLWPAWVFCTRYSDRPSSGPRSRRVKRKRPGPTSSSLSSSSSSSSSSPARGAAGEAGRGQTTPEEKRPRTAFTSEQLTRLKREFDDCRYLTEARRRHLAAELGLTESQIKIWFQNKRAKIKKSSGVKNELALQLMAQGLYNHSTITVQEDADEDVDDVMVC